MVMVAGYVETKNVLGLIDNFITFEWLKQYEPLDETMATMKQVLYHPQALTA